MSESLAEQQNEIMELEATLTQNQQLKSDQLARLDQMNGQQTELSDIINQLQVELLNLQGEHQQTIATAAQTRDQLASAQLRITALDQELVRTKTELREASITISNQQRALKAASSQTPTGANTSASTLSGILTSLFDDISVTETARGETVVSIPLDYLFLSNDLDFSPNADLILAPIATELNGSLKRDAWVIGHSDARPIVSDLSKTYPTNWELSTARASRVVNYFINRGVSANQLTAAGKASNQPVRDDGTTDALAINRRIEIQIR